VKKRLEVAEIVGPWEKYGNHNNKGLTTPKRKRGQHNLLYSKVLVKSNEFRQVGRCLQRRHIAMLSEWLNNVFPFDFGRVGFGALPSGNRK
jgi:hypothetical protein